MKIRIFAGTIVVATALAAGCGTAKAPAPYHTPSGHVPASVVTTPAATDQQAWLAGPGGTALKNLAAVLGQFGTDATAFSATQSTGPILADCLSMRTDATAALDATPDPDVNVNGHLSAAYASILSAANACVTGIQDYTSGDMTDAIALIQTATSDMNQGNAQIQDATAAINS